MNSTLEGRARKSGQVTAAILAGLVAVPVLVLLARTLAALPDDAKVTGDAALMELYTLRAASGDQLLGPYSRFYFHHPGPVLFYCLAPFYLALGKNYAALATGALVLNLVSLVGIAIVLRRLVGADRWPWGLAALGLYVLWLRPMLLVSAWNPNLAILPLALALLALAAVAAGRTAYLPLAVLAGSFAVQSHIPCAAPVAVASAVAVAVPVVRRRWWATAPGPSAAHAAGHAATAAVLLGLVWLLPIVEQVRGNPGNVTMIVRYLGQRHEWRSFGSTLSAVATQASAFLLAPVAPGSESDPPSSLAPPLALLATAFLAALLLAVVRAWRRRDAFAFAACSVAIGGAAVAVAQTLATPGYLHAYLVRWISAVGLVAACAIAAALAPSGPARLAARARQLGICAVVVVTAAALALRDVVRSPGLGQLIASAWSDRVSNPTLAALAARGIRHPEIRILSHRSWEQAAGLVLQCTKAGRPPTVDDSWSFMFGDACRIREADDGVVLIADRATAAPYAAIGGVAPVVTAGEDAVLVASPDRPLADGLRLADPESEIYVRRGFSGREREADGGFRWSNGPESALVLPATPGKRCRLEVLASPIVVAGLPAEVLTVEVNRRRLAAVEMSPGWKTYAFAVPAGEVRARNLVGFRYSLVRSPSELGGGADTRRLAVRFRSISLAAVAGE